MQLQSPGKLLQNVKLMKSYIELLNQNYVQQQV